MDRETAVPCAPQTGFWQRSYSAGTLRYSVGSLGILFGWLLWGDFAFTFFESVFARFMPLYLKDLHASNSLIGIMTGSIAGLVNIFLLPNISQWSDRCRSRWGRRIPFLLLTTPLAVGSLVLIGYAPEIGTFLNDGVIVAWAPEVSKDAVILAFLCVCVVAYHLFNMVLVNAYNWLLRDVVPQAVMTPFLSWFKVVGTIGAFLFLWYVFPNAETSRKAVFTGVGIFYLVAFLSMCLRVREGGYPPAPERGNSGGLIKGFLSYFRECLGIVFYRNFFIMYVLTVIATSSATPFLGLFARETLGLGMGDIGKAYAWNALGCAVTYFPVGWLCVRFDPLRVTMVSLAGYALMSCAAFFAAHDRATWMIYSVATAIPGVGINLGIMAATMMLFPKREFGQFASGINVFGCGGLIIGNYLIGRIIDLTGSNYRITFLWSIVFFALAMIPMALVYTGWKKLGGTHNYIPPDPNGSDSIWP